MKTTVFILISVILLSRGWYLVSDEHPLIISVWERVGVDLSALYDTHPFYNYPKDQQGEKLKWIIHDYGYLFSILFLILLIKKRIISTRRDRIVVNVFYYYSIFRLFEYWLFRFDIGLAAITSGIVLFYSVLTLKKWQI